MLTPLDPVRSALIDASNAMQDIDPTEKPRCAAILKALEQHIDAALHLVDVLTTERPDDGPER